MNPRAPKEDDEGKRDRENLIALIVIGVLVLICVVILLLYLQGSNELDCFLAGHRNCAPIDTNAH